MANSSPSNCTDINALAVQPGMGKGFIWGVALLLPLNELLLKCQQSKNTPYWLPDLVLFKIAYYCKYY